jgi:hypothetical protein
MQRQYQRYCKHFLARIFRAFVGDWDNNEDSPLGLLSVEHVVGWLARGPTWQDWLLNELAPSPTDRIRQGCCVEVWCVAVVLYGADERTGKLKQLAAVLNSLH